MISEPFRAVLATGTAGRATERMRYSRLHVRFARPIGACAADAVLPVPR